MKKVAMWTDIHFGRHNNSTQHSQDCLDFISWFCNIVRSDSDITHAVFLGDWFENRNAINVATLNAACDAVAMLNDLNIPIYILVGNHDLYHRENRKIFSTMVFREFSNVKLIDDLEVIEDTILLSPFLFKEEYPRLAAYNSLKYWMGHFEFRNFFITGSNRVMEHGPDHKSFNGPTYIFSGHFHKRQANDNVIYIGNAMPLDYGDAWDDERGAAILDTRNENVDFLNWDDCPKYRKVKLSDVLSTPNLSFPPKCRVRCTIDADIGYSEAQQLKEELISQLHLREFSLEEDRFEKKDAIEGQEDIDGLDLSSLDDAVVIMLKTGVTGTSTIDADHLVKIYYLL